MKKKIVIMDLGLSVRAFFVLDYYIKERFRKQIHWRSGGFYSSHEFDLHKIKDLQERELFSMRNCGVKTVNEIMQALRKNGIIQND